MLKEGQSIYVVCTLQKLLELFDDEAIIEDFALGDTWHPASGSVDARMIFTPNPTVKEVREHDYDWKGLVEFGCRIGELTIERVSDTKERTVYEFRITGPFKTLLKLEHLLIERAAYNPGVYEF